jgi:hypothetical protein
MASPHTLAEVSEGVKPKLFNFLFDLSASSPEQAAKSLKV